MVAGNTPNLYAINFFMNVIYIKHSQIYEVRCIFEVFVG
jgi:hypothetical protein